MEVKHMEHIGYGHPFRCPCGDNGKQSARGVAAVLRRRTSLTIEIQRI